MKTSGTGVTVTGNSPSLQVEDTSNSTWDPAEAVMPHIVGEERKKEFSTKEPPMSLRENVLVMKGTYNMLIEHP